MTESHKHHSQTVEAGLSRRDLFRTVGLAAGGAVLLGLPKFVGGWAGEAEAAMDTRAYAGTASLALEIDGQAIPLLSVEGGHAVADVILEPVGPDGIAVKRPGAVRYEDLLVTLPMGTGSKALGDWLTNSLGKPGPSAKNGAIIYSGPDGKEIKRLGFTGALLSEVVVPQASAADTTQAMLFLRLTPQSTLLLGPSGGVLKASLGAKQATVLSSNFRLNVQGLEQACGRIAKVHPLITRRFTGSNSVGDFRQPKNPLGPWNCANVSVILPEADAGPFYQWFDDLVVKAKPGGERKGLLEWMDQSMKVAASVQLDGLGIVRYAPEPVILGSSQKAGMVQVDLYCETMKVLLS